MCRRRICALVGLVSLSLTVAAQLREADTLRWHTSYRADGTWSGGNVRRTLALLGSEVLHIAGRWGFKSVNTYQYGMFAARVSEDDYASRNFGYWQPGSRVYPFAMVWAERSLRQQVDLRWQLGAGATYRLLATPAQGLRVSLAGTYEQADFRNSDFAEPAPTTSRRLVTWRATLRLAGTHLLNTQGLRLTYETWFQQSLPQWANYRTYASGSLSVPVATRLRCTASVVYTHENLHLRKIRPDDTLLLVGLRWETTPPALRP